MLDKVAVWAIVLVALWLGFGYVMEHEVSFYVGQYFNALLKGVLQA